MSDSNVGAATERRSSRPAKRVAAKAPVLPSARAAVGALLCVLAALLTFVAYRQAQQPPTTKYLVAVHEMKPGAPLLAADLREEAITLPPQVAARAFTSFAQLQNAFLLGPIQQGELLQASNLANRSGGAGSFEWSFTIESIRAAGGFFRVGERVQILGTLSKDGQSVTEVVNPSALIIAMDRTDPNPFRGSVSILLALNSQAEVFRMQNALDNQKLTVVRGVDAAAQKSVKDNEAAPSPATKAAQTPAANASGAQSNTDSLVSAGAADGAADETNVATPTADPSLASNPSLASDPSPAPTSPENPS
jgi:Flp pilus assembly protein CpaB